MDYAVASTRRSATCSPTAPTWCRWTSPTCRRGPKARQYGVRALNRALEGVGGTTAVHICFGYAAIIHARPQRLASCPSCRPATLPADLDRDGAVNLDCSVLETAAGQADHGGLHRPLQPQVESPVVVAAASSAPEVPQARAGDPGAGLRHEVPAARRGRRQAARHGQAAKILRAEHARKGRLKRQTGLRP